MTTERATIFPHSLQRPQGHIAYYCWVKIVDLKAQNVVHSRPTSSKRTRVTCFELVDQLPQYGGQQKRFYMFAQLDKKHHRNTLTINRYAGMTEKTGRKERNIVPYLFLLQSEAP